MADDAGHNSSSSRLAAEPPPGASAAGAPARGANALRRVIPRRPRVTWWLGLVFAVVFSALATPVITADRWLQAMGAATIVKDQPAPVTVRVPAFTGLETTEGGVRGGVVVARGEIATIDDAALAEAIAAATPRGPLPYLAFFALTCVLATIFTHHMRRSTRGRLVRVQVVSLAATALLAIAAKSLLLGSAASVLVVPVAVLAMVPTMVLDRVVGLATGILAALVVSLLGPFDLGVAILMLVQAATAGLVVAERPKRVWRSALAAGAVTTVFTAATYVLLTYLTRGRMPELDGMRTPLLAAAIGPAIAMVLAAPLIPLYQLLVGEITQSKLVELEDLSNPLLRQIAERSPGTWQHSLMMANMAEIAANAIGANGRLVRVGAYYHDLGKSLQPKYFIENLEPGETSPHDQLPPEVSCDAIFAHVTEGIVAARKAGLHERIVDFMHMHHGDGVLEYFWGKCREQGNPHGLAVEQFRYPGHPPQTRETAILAICDAVEAASRTLKKPDPAAIDALVQRIVYGKLHLGQLDESGLSMGDLRRVSDSLRETIRHANHGRIEYPWQKAQQDASASQSTVLAKPAPTTTGSTTGPEPRLDSLDRKPRRDTAMRPAVLPELDEDDGAILLEKRSTKPSGDLERDRALAIAQTADLRGGDDLALVETAQVTAPPAAPAAPPAPEARAKAATLPPTPPRRAPTVPPPPSFASARAPTNSDLAPKQTLMGRPPGDRAPADATGPHKKPTDLAVGLATLQGPPPPARLPATAAESPSPAASTPSMSAMPARPSSPSATPPRTAGPPERVDLENMVTNPPPLRRGPSGAPATRLPPVIASRADDEQTRVTTPQKAYELETIDAIESPFRELPLRAPPTVPPGPPDADEWQMETPVVPPTKEALRALLGVPDPTRKQSVDELEALHRAVEDDVSEDLLPARRPAPRTFEVDPDDIEAAIQIAPPARSRPPSSVAVAKPKKPE